jgi:radical SAM-linked protein
VSAGGGGKGRLDRGSLADSRLDMPLPWDHIDTGISKVWLKTDLQRALEAATVPDCSHSGLCSECGVCGDDFGENIVAAQPPIPAFDGHYVPDSRRAVRVRLQLHKFGDMVFVGHLDFLRMIERACRRAALPVSSDSSPYNPRTRISYAAALPLGGTSSAEVLELMMVEKCDPEEVATKLQAQLPHGVKVACARVIPAFRMNGSASEGLGALLRSVTYELVVVDGTVRDQGVQNNETEHPRGHLKAAVAAVRNATSFLVRKKSKKRGKSRKIDLRKGVVAIDVVESVFNCEAARFAPEVVGRVALSASGPHDWGIVRVQLKTDGDGGHMKSRAFVEMLAEVSGRAFRLAHVHRCDVMPFHR